MKKIKEQQQLHKLETNNLNINLSLFKTLCQDLYKQFYPFIWQKDIDELLDELGDNFLAFEVDKKHSQEETLHSNSEMSSDSEEDLFATENDSFIDDEDMSDCWSSSTEDKKAETPV